MAWGAKTLGTFSCDCRRYKEIRRELRHTRISYITRRPIVMSRSSILRSIAGRVQNVAPMMDTVSSSSLATFATKAAAPSPKLPPQFGIPGRYAAALYMASFKAGTLSNIEKEVSALRSVLGASAELKAFVSEPGMPAKTRSAGLGAVLDKVGVKDATVKRFLDVVVENKRTSDLEGMLSKFQEIAAQQRGEVKASVTTLQCSTSENRSVVKLGAKVPCNSTSPLTHWSAPTTAPTICPTRLPCLPLHLAALSCTHRIATWTKSQQAQPSRAM